ncbi:dynein heavy chain [Gigaspora margarita]|uniref:Dynein heavy chain n=1 Tax=Gigaspora margarita TaxID=4874 RepID=A0A8H4AX18_GIGMA|nr:dynein heavy chain [Gigaspora margarita]
MENDNTSEATVLKLKLCFREIKISIAICILTMSKSALLTCLEDYYDTMYRTKEVLDMNSTIEDCQDSILGNISDLKSPIFSIWILGDTVNTYIKVNPILSELKSEALKDRHWKQLFKALELETVSMIGILILKQREPLKNIIAQVSGEEMNINRRSSRNNPVA